MTKVVLSTQSKIVMATSGLVYGLQSRKQTHFSMQPVHMCLVRSLLCFIFILLLLLFLPTYKVIKLTSPLLALGATIQAFDYVTNRMSNMTTTSGIAREVTTTGKILTHVPIKHNWKTLPMQMLVVLVFIAAVSTAVIYPSMSPYPPPFGI